MEVLRFALLGLGLGALLRARLAGPDGDLPGLGRAELRPRRHRHGRRLRVLGGQGRARPAGVGRLDLAGLGAVRADRCARPSAGHAPAAAGLAAGPHRGHAGHADRHPIGGRAALRRHGSRRSSPSCPRTPSTSPASTVSVDRFILLGIAVVMSVGLYAVLPLHAGSAWRPRPWPRTSARPAALGLSPDRIATANWALGSALAGVAGILIAPIVPLQVADDDQPRPGRDGRRAGRRLPLASRSRFAAGSPSASARPSSTGTSHTPGVAAVAAVRRRSSCGWSSGARRCRCATTSCSACPRSAAAASDPASWSSPSLSAPAC